MVNNLLYTSEVIMLKTSKKLIMRNLIVVFMLSLFFFSCEEEKKVVNISEVAKEVEKEPLEEKPQIEAITDFEKVEELKNKIKEEQEAAERARLDTLPLSMRLAENDSLAFDSINSLLNSGNTKEINDFLNQFLRFKPIKYKLSEESIKSNFYKLLSDTNTERLAMKTIGILNLNYEAAFVDQYKNTSSKLKDKYFYWLGRKGKNMEVLQDVNDQIKRNKIPKEQQEYILYGLKQFSNSKDEAVKDKAITSALLAYKNKWITPQDIATLKDKDNRSEKAEAFLKMMLENGGEKAKSIHNICLKQGILVHKVFENLVNAKDGRAKSILLKQLSDRKMFLKTLPAVPMVYKMQEDSTIPIKTIQMLSKHKYMSPEVGDKVHYIFEKMNCINYLKNADKYIKDKDLITALKKQAQRPKPAPQTYEEIVLDLFASKITDSIDYNTLQQIKTNEVYQGKNALIKNVLHHNKQIVTIDKWATKTPIDYDFILNGIKKQLDNELSQLIFKSEFSNNAYSILMIGTDKALFVHPENKKDEIEAKLLIDAINELIKDKKLHIIYDDPDYIEAFFGTENELNILKGLMQKNNQEDLPI